MDNHQIWMLVASHLRLSRQHGIRLAICLEHTHTTSTTERAPGELAYRVKYIKNNAAACELDESAPLLYTKPRLSCSILNAFFKGQRAISPRA